MIDYTLVAQVLEACRYPNKPFDFLVFKATWQHHGLPEADFEFLKRNGLHVVTVKNDELVDLLKKHHGAVAASNTLTQSVPQQSLPLPPLPLPAAPVEAPSLPLAPPPVPEPSLPEPSQHEEILLALQQLAASEADSIEEELALKDIKDAHKIGIQILRDHYSKVKASLLDEKQIKRVLTPEEAALQEQEKQQIDLFVKQLQSVSNIFPTFHHYLIQAGFICTEETARSIFFTHAFRLLKHSSGFFFTGESASGKTVGIFIAAEFLPPETVIVLTTMSEQAIFYIGPIKHKILFFGEMQPRVDDQDDYKQQNLRQLITENVVTRLTVEKIPGQPNRGVMLKTEGPAVIIATSTATQNLFDDELQNRSSWITSDDSVETTQKVLAAIAFRAENPVQSQDVALAIVKKAFQEFYRSLEFEEDLTVVIPYGTLIIPTDEHVTVRRLSPLILSYVKASALYHQHCREKTTLEGQPVIIATFDDYRAAYAALSANAPKPLENVPTAARKAFDKHLKPLLSNNWANSTELTSNTNSALTLNRLVQILGRPQKTVARWIQAWEKDGLISRAPFKDGKQFVYSLTGSTTEHFTQNLGLVSPETLEQRWQQRQQQQFKEVI